MREFEEAVDGYFDVEGQLWYYLRRRAAEQFSNEREAKQEIDSRDEFETRRERVRETFLAGIGGLPERPGDLSVERMGVVDQEGYSIERLTFESSRDFHVTANCYVPEGDGPHPGLLFCCGHVNAAKADPLNQKACIELALSGFVVREYPFDPRLTVFDVLRDCDVPHLLAALDDRALTVERSTD